MCSLAYLLSCIDFVFDIATILKSVLNLYIYVCFKQVNKSIGKWVLQSANVYSSLSGITTNQSEGFNTVLKQYQHWKEIPIDSLVLGLYHLQVYYNNEVQRGYCGLGEYKLRSQYSFLSRPLNEALLHHVPSPEEIVSSMQPNSSDNKLVDSKLETVVENAAETVNCDDSDDENMHSSTTVTTDSKASISQLSRAR